MDDGFKTGAEKLRLEKLIERPARTDRGEYAVGVKESGERCQANSLLLEIPELLARVVAVLDDDLDRVGVVHEDLRAKL